MLQCRDGEDEFNTVVPEGQRMGIPKEWGIEGVNVKSHVLKSGVFTDGSMDRLPAGEVKHQTPTPLGPGEITHQGLTQMPRYPDPMEVNFWRGIRQKSVGLERLLGKVVGLQRKLQWNNLGLLQS
jgi:hypothetical protein